MPSLKDLRGRINSVKSTRKITQAMKMVAAAKLRRAQSQAEAARPYAERMARILASLGASVAGTPDAPKLLVGTGADKVHLLVVVTGDRGLAGPFNTNVGRFARARIRAWKRKARRSRC
jgi:F-type H+-transporting ATPase subunit gamma